MVCIYIHIYIPHSLSVAALCQVQLLGDWEARRQAVQALELSLEQVCLLMKAIDKPFHIKWYIN